MLPLKITNNTFIMHQRNSHQQTLFGTISLWGIHKHSVHSLLATRKSYQWFMDGTYFTFVLPCVHRNRFLFK